MSKLFLANKVPRAYDTATVQDIVRQLERQSNLLTDKISWLVSVKDFGATGDGTTVDTAAIQAAIDEVEAAGGGMLLFPRGVYLVSSLTIDSANVSLVGAGYGASIIRTNSTTADVLTISAGLSTIRGLGFDSSVTRTSGYYISAEAGEIYIYECYMTEAHGGIFIGTSNAVVTVDQCHFRDFVTGGDCIHIDSSGADFTISECIFDHDADAMPNAGIRVRRAQDVTISGCNIIHCGTDLLIDPVTDDVVAAVYATNTFFDTATAGAVLTGENGGSIVRCSFDRCWFSSHEEHGALLDTSVDGAINGVSFIDPHAHLNTLDGIHLEGADTENVTIMGGVCAENTAAGVSVGNGVTKFYFQKVISGAVHGLAGNAHGIFIGTGCSDFEVSDCIVEDNTTFDVTMGSSTGVVRGNKGYITKAKGSATILDNTTSIAVSHGLSSTPVDGEIMVTPISGLGAAAEFWVGSYTASQFTISCDLDPNVNISFAWSADLEARNL